MKRALSLSDEDIDNLLGKVLKTRIQKKAKAIIRTGINFLATNIVILLSASDIAANENLGSGMSVINVMTSCALGNVVALSALYVICLCLFLLTHSATFPYERTMTSQKVEDAYEVTNKYPAIDGILEFGFPAKFKGNYWRLPYLVLAVCIGITVSGASFCYQESETISDTTKASLFTAMLLLFQIATDFSEYWVYTRNQVPKTIENNDIDDGKLLLQASDTGKLA